METKTERYGDAMIVQCRGELSEDSLEPLDKEMRRQITGSVESVVLDFAAVPFVDSVGLEFLLDLQDRLAEKSGRLAIANPDEHVRKIFEITRMNESLVIVADAMEAVRGIGA